MDSSILVVCTFEGIGDTCLALPAIGYLRQHYPKIKIKVLVREYTADVVRRCHGIDEILIWRKQSIDETTLLLKTANIEHVIHLDRRYIIAESAKKAKIPKRSGMLCWSHLMYCNHLLSRSFVKKNHESLFYIRLAGEAMGIPIEVSAFTHQQVSRLAGYCASRHRSSQDQDKQILLHPFSRGHGREWLTTSYASLAHQLVKQGWRVLVGGRASEYDKLGEYKDMFPADVQWCMNLSNLSDYIDIIEQSHVVIASGTGPLHIAGLTGAICIGLYPPPFSKRKEYLSSFHWAPLGERVLILENIVPCTKICTNSNCACMQSITVEQVMTAIQTKSFPVLVHPFASIW